LTRRVPYLKALAGKLTDPGWRSGDEEGTESPRFEEKVRKCSGWQSGQQIRAKPEQWLLQSR